jgi:hypothetical protein
VGGEVFQREGLPSAHPQPTLLGLESSRKKSRDFCMCLVLVATVRTVLALRMVSAHVASQGGSGSSGQILSFQTRHPHLLSLQWAWL